MCDSSKFNAHARKERAASRSDASYEIRDHVLDPPPDACM